jgi:phage tail-like protein
MALVQLPSVLVDAVAEDFSDATAGTVLSANSAPFAITDTGTLQLKVDGGSTQTITFNAVDFDDLGAVPVNELVTVLNAFLVGATASAQGAKVCISSDTWGTTGTVQIVAEPLQPSSATAAFAFPTGVHAGTDASSETVLINRVPEPGESAVPLDSTIGFEIFRTTAADAAALPAALNVLINGVAAVQAGTAVNGWIIATTVPHSSTLGVQLTGPGFLLTDSDVVVAVAVPTISFASSYVFRTFDAVRPRALTAVATGKHTIRVTFSEAVRMLDPSASDDALNPTNFLIDRVTRPAVALTVATVHSVSASIVELRTDIEMSYGAGYELTVFGVTDIVGNVHVEAPDNVIAFTGFMPTFPAGRRFLVQDFIPAMNLAEDSTGDLRAFLAVLQEVLNVQLSGIDDWSQILDLDVAPEGIVDAMLGDLGNPFDRFDLDLVDKRRLLRILVRLYKLKGTKPGMVAAIKFFTGLDIDVETYTGTGWELSEAGDDITGDELSDASDDGDPAAVLGPDRRGLYSFRIVAPVALNVTQRDYVETLAEYMKVAHEHYLGTTEPMGPWPPFSTGITDPDDVILDHVVLEFSELGSEGSDPGDFQLHE